MARFNFKGGFNPFGGSVSDSGYDAATLPNFRVSPEPAPDLFFGESSPFGGGGLSDKPFLSPEVLEAVDARKDANDAANTATNQYEADVADFKDIKATEIEQGIASLPELQNMNTGFGDFDFSRLQDRLANLEQKEVPTYDDSQLREEMNTRFSNFYNFDPSALQNRLANLEQKEVPTYDDSQLREEMNTRFGDFYNFDPSSLQDRLAELEQKEVPTYDDSQLREEINTRFDDFNPFSDVFTPLPETTVVEEPVNPYDFITRSDNNYMDENYTIEPVPGQPYFGPENYRFDDIMNYPLSPYHPDYVPYAAPTMPGIMYPTTLPGGAPFPGSVPEDTEVPESVPEYTGPRNYYTGEPILNPYQPYSTDSGAAPLKRKITPEEFGRIPAVRPPTPLPRPFVDESDVSDKPIKRANNGGYLNKGISQLPMNGQGDTLTTQIFQSGFRPRR